MFYLYVSLLFAVIFAVRFFAKRHVVNRWRQQLEKGDKVRFFYQTYQVGTIKDFYEGGETIAIKFGEGPKYILLPLKVLVPPQ